MGPSHKENHPLEEVMPSDVVDVYWHLGRKYSINVKAIRVL
jgi:hypothetical protein